MSLAKVNVVISGHSILGSLIITVFTLFFMLLHNSNLWNVVYVNALYTRVSYRIINNWEIISSCAVRIIKYTHMFVTGKLPLHIFFIMPTKRIYSYIGLFFIKNSGHWHFRTCTLQISYLYVLMHNCLWPSLCLFAWYPW